MCTVNKLKNPELQFNPQAVDPPKNERLRTQK